jgi:hypothetical protein
MRRFVVALASICGLFGVLPLGAGCGSDDANGDERSCEQSPPCPAGMVVWQDVRCVDPSSGEAEECAADSRRVDHGVRCFFTCPGGPDAKECPPCAPECKQIMTSAFCDTNLGFVCTPKGMPGGCYQ